MSATLIFTRGEFEIATQDGIYAVHGVISGGLGLHQPIAHEPYWRITHLASGHFVGQAMCSFDHAKVVVEKLLPIADWLLPVSEFGPDLRWKCASVFEGTEFEFGNGRWRSSEQADQIAARRGWSI